MPKWDCGPSINVISPLEAEALLSWFLHTITNLHTPEGRSVVSASAFEVFSPGCPAPSGDTGKGHWFVAAPRMARISALMAPRGQDRVYDSHRETLGERVWDGLSGGRVRLWFSP